jgi:transposase-like protein
MSQTLKRRQYSLSFKLRVIKHYETNGRSLNKTARDYVVDRKTIRSWIASKEKIKSTTMKTTRSKAKRKPVESVHPEMEMQLHSWIKTVRLSGGCVDGKTIQTKALQMMKDDKSFTASRGWLMRFLQRKRLTLRRITTTGRAPPKNMRSIVQNFIMGSVEKFKDQQRNSIFNMDETSIYLDYPSKHSSVFLRTGTPHS